MEVDTDKQLSLLRQSRPESVSVVSQVVSCFHVVLLFHILIGIAAFVLKGQENSGGLELERLIVPLFWEQFFFCVRIEVSFFGGS